MFPIYAYTYQFSQYSTQYVTHLWYILFIKQSQPSKTIAHVTKRLNGGLCERREESNEADVECWIATASAHAY